MRTSVNFASVRRPALDTTELLLSFVTLQKRVLQVAVCLWARGWLVRPVDLKLGWLAIIRKQLQMLSKRLAANQSQFSHKNTVPSLLPARLSVCPSVCPAALWHDCILLLFSDHHPSWCTFRRLAEDESLKKASSTSTLELFTICSIRFTFRKYLKVQAFIFYI